MRHVHRSRRLGDRISDTELRRTAWGSDGYVLASRMTFADKKLRRWRID